MDKLYNMSPVTISERVTSDHNMVVLKPSINLPCSNGSVMRVSIRAMGVNEKAFFIQHFLLLVGNHYLG